MTLALNRDSYKLHLSVVDAICLMHFWKPNQFALVAKPVDKAIRALVDFGRPFRWRRAGF
jgi:hypothetical protein